MLASKVSNQVELQVRLSTLFVEAHAMHSSYAVACVAAADSPVPITFLVKLFVTL